MNKKIFATLILGITVATTFQMCKKPAIKNEITKNEIYKRLLKICSNPYNLTFAFYKTPNFKYLQ